MEHAQKPLHTLVGHKDAIVCLDFSPDSKLLGSSCLGNLAMVWDTTTGREKARWLHGAGDHQVYAIRFHPTDRAIITSCWDGRVRVWELGKRDPTRVLLGPFGAREGGQPGVARPGDKTGISKLVIDPTGTRLLTEISSYKAPVLWDLKTGKPKLLDPSDDSGSLCDLAFSPDGKRFVVAHASNGRGEQLLKVWDTEKEMVVGSIKTDKTESYSHVCYSPNGKLIAGAGTGGIINIWDAEKLIEVAAPKRHEQQVRGLQFTPDSKYLVSCTSGTPPNKPAGEVFIWDVVAKKHVLKFVPHQNGCFALAISSDGKLLATGADDGEVCLWDLVTIRKQIEAIK